jgi:hypothetical protein
MTKRQFQEFLKDSGSNLVDHLLKSNALRSDRTIKVTKLKIIKTIKLKFSLTIARSLLRGSLVAVRKKGTIIFCCTFCMLPQLIF